MKLWPFFAGAGTIALAVIGVKKYQQLKEFRRIGYSLPTIPFRIDKISGGTVYGFIEILFNNPTSISVQIKNLQADLTHLGDSLAKVNLSTGVIYPSMVTSVIVPVQITTKKMLRLAEDVLLKPKAIVIVRGSFHFSSSVISIPFSVPFTFEIDVKDQVKDFLTRPLSGIKL